MAVLGTTVATCGPKGRALSMVTKVFLSDTIFRVTKEGQDGGLIPVTHRLREAQDFVSKRLDLTEARLSIASPVSGFHQVKESVMADSLCHVLNSGEDGVKRPV